jgi:hypothetical protein
MELILKRTLVTLTLLDFVNVADPDDFCLVRYKRAEIKKLKDAFLPFCCTIRMYTCCNISIVFFQI